MGEGGILIALPPLWENLRPMLGKFAVMKVLLYIITWYMKLLTLSYPLQYMKRLVTPAR